MTGRECLLKCYAELIERFGDPGPWPWFDRGKQRPHTKEEIVIGAVLTQNTNWRNVEYALENLRSESVCGLKEIVRIGKRNMKHLQQLIRPAGFFHQKSERLFAVARFILKHGSIESFRKTLLRKAREQLLAIKGIGPETADTILLYACGKRIFVIDTYTKRFVLVKRLSKKQNYDELQEYFMANLPRSFSLYQAYHALVVQWGKFRSPFLSAHASSP
jgi:endonuclease-3 related protein